MKDIFIEKFDGNSLWHERDAMMISYWSDQSDSVLHVDYQTIRDEHPYGLLAQGPGGILGYVAVKELIHNGKVGQVGSLIISPYHQGNGIASLLIDEIVKHAPENLPEMQASFAYGNQGSTPLFERYDGIVIGERETSASTGCNDVIELTGAMELPGLEDATLTGILDVNETRIN